jgi:hypothetical protein
MHSEAQGSESNQENAEFRAPENVTAASDAVNNSPETRSASGLVQAIHDIQKAKTRSEMGYIISEYNKTLPAAEEGAEPAGSAKLPAQVKVEGITYDILMHGGKRPILDFEVADQASLEERKREQVDLQQRWEQISGNKMYRGILAKCVRDRFDDRDKVNIKDVADFYKKFPNKHDFSTSFDLEKLLENIRINNGLDKVQEYSVAAGEFSQIMFPGQ